MASKNNVCSSCVPSSVADLRHDYRDLVYRPLITEKSMDQKEFNRYTFLVDLRANKIEIRHAIEKAFNVTVTKVTTVRVNGKMKRRGRVLSKRPDYKKAYVTLKAGCQIEVDGTPLFEQ